MKFTIFITITNFIIWSLLGFYYIVLNPYDEIYSLTIPAVLFTILFLVATRKAYLLGMNTVRARNIFFIGIGLLLLAIGFFLFQSKFPNYIIYPLLYIGHLSLVSAVVYMFINLLKHGYGLTFDEILQVFVISMILIIVGYWVLMKDYKFDERFFYNLILIILGYIIVIFAIINLRIYWGSDLGIRWLLGSISAIMFFISDVIFVLYLSNNKPEFIYSASLLWGLAAILLCFVFSLPD